MLQVAALFDCDENQIIKDAAKIVALLSPMVEAKPEPVADPSDPHAALRASYRPGQKWEFTFTGSDEWSEIVNPSWLTAYQYRLKEDQS